MFFYGQEYKQNWSIFSLTQIIKAGNFNRMEKMRFEKALKLWKDEGIIPEHITTDGHICIRKYLKEEKPNITHQFDVWHFVVQEFLKFIILCTVNGLLNGNIFCALVC